MVVDFDLGPCTIDPPTPDAYILDPTANPSAGISRLCWGWRSDLEVAIRECRHKRANKIVAQRLGGQRGSQGGKEEVRAFAECNNLTYLAAARGELKTVRLLVEVLGCDVEALHSTRYDDPTLDEAERRRRREGAASKRVDAVRRMRGYNGTTPLYAASQGEPEFSEEKRSRVVEYLLARGADPMRPNDASIFPLFIACANYQLEVVKLMLATGRCDVHKTIKDGESPYSIAERNVTMDPNGELYRPLLELVRKHAAAVGRAPVAQEETDPVAAAFNRATMKKQLGNERFKEKGYSEAACLYRSALDILGKADAGNKVSDEEKDLRITLHSNSAEAFLQLGAFVRAREHCEASLKLSPSHTKSKRRLSRSRAMEAKYRAAEKTFNEKFQKFSRLADENKFHDALAIMTGTEQLAVKELDPFHRVRALLAQAEMSFHLGTTASKGDAFEDQKHLERADKMANETLPICHNYMRRSYEVDRSTSKDTTQTEVRVKLLIKEATTWFLIAQIYRVRHGHEDPAGFAVKLREAQAQLDRAEHEMEGEYVIEEAEGIRFSIREAAATDAAQLGQWDRAMEACRDSLDDLKHYVEQGSQTMFDRYALIVSQMAECLSHGVRNEPVRSLMNEMLHFVADTHEKNGNLLEAAKTIRFLINHRHTGWQTYRYTEKKLSDSLEPPNDEEASRDNADVARLLDLLKRMGRDDDGCCSICLDPLEGGHPDVLSCLHMFHPGCIRQLFDQKYAKDMRRDSVSGHVISMGECPNCREKVELKMMYASQTPSS